jgi:hypothetical protein
MVAGSTSRRTTKRLPPEFSQRMSLKLAPGRHEVEADRHELTGSYGGTASVEVRAAHPSTRSPTHPDALPPPGAGP